MHIHIPADVPPSMEKEYEKNYNTITHGTGRLALFAGDQKMEHMNDDFYGKGISPEDAEPEHMFKIASMAKIGAFAAQLGLINRYGKDYPNIPYIVKMNSKSPLIPVSQAEPVNRQLVNFHMIDQVIKNSGLRIAGIGYTVYVGSEHESVMYEEASRHIFEAHQRGLITILWMYPRGKAVKSEKDPHIIAGAAGIGACLGADFVKLNYPEVKEANPAESLKEAIKAAGRTQVVCAGGSHAEPEDFLKTLYDQIHIGGASGNATGRNIHQRSLEEAIRFANAIFAITVQDANIEEAIRIYRTESIAIK